LTFFSFACVVVPPPPPPPDEGAEGADAGDAGAGVDGSAAAASPSCSPNSDISGLREYSLKVLMILSTSKSISINILKLPFIYPYLKGANLDWFWKIFGVE
jgi:hypothetical protein